MKNNIKLQKYGRLLLAFLSTVFLIIMCWIIIDCFTLKSNSSKKIISYHVNDDINYEVLLKNNEFFNEEDVGKNNSYVTSLIDSLKVNFDYQLVGSNFFNSEYNYRVETSLKSLQNGKVFWHYEENSLEEMNENVSDVMSIQLGNDVFIDVNHFYDRAHKFYELTGYDVMMEVNVIINSNLYVKDYSDSINDEQVLTISFPITDKVTTINKSSKENDNKKVFSQYEVNETFNYYLFTLSSLILIALIPLTVMSYVSLFNLTNLDEYNRKLNMYKKKYHDLLKEHHTEPKMLNKEIIDVKNIKDLVEICKDKDLNINFYEFLSNRECWFYVEEEKKVYLYILRLDHQYIDISDRTMVIKLKKNRDKKKSTKKRK